MLCRDVFRTPAYRSSQLVDTAATNSQQTQYTKIEVSRHFQEEWIKSRAKN